MPTNILLAAVGAGKTEIVLEQLTRVTSAQPFARVWVLLATRRQEDAFRERLTRRSQEQQVYFNVEFFNFYTLYDRLLDMAGVPPRHLNDTARFGLLRAVLRDLQKQGQLQLYDAIALKPGFIRITADFIYELKQNRIYPHDFQGAARTAKDHELALIYAAYQQRLIDHNLVDREGAGWLALDMLAEPSYKMIASNVDLLLVDGFDQFTVVQADLLALLANRAHDTLITLTTVPGREATVGRRFQRAYDRLAERYARVGEEITPIETGQAADTRHIDLQYLAETIFQLNSEPTPAQNGLTCVEAPDPKQEVGIVLREVKRRLLVDGQSPDEIIITLRNWSLYQSHFFALGQKYGLPLALHYGQPLAQNPALRALFDLLALHMGDFRRVELLDILRSPYFDIPDLGGSAADLLERLSQKLLIVGGRAAWLEGIRQALSVQEGAPSDDDEVDRPELIGLDEYLLIALNRFFDAVTPPPQASIDDYIFWLEGLIGPDSALDPDEDAIDENQAGYRLRMLWQVRQDAPDTLVARDLAALQALKDVLYSLRSAQSLLRALGESRTLSWEDFLADLTTGVENTTINPRPNRTGRILVTTATDARGLPHDHVFVLGLSEGIFPLPLAEDPLYLDSERLALRARGIYLETQAERTADDGLFYELISLPRRSLTLSRPTIQEGKPWIESHLWRAVQRLFTDLPLRRLGLSAVVPPADVATLDEAALAVAAELNLSVLDEDGVGLYNWLHKQPYWTHIYNGWRIEQARLSTQAHNHYSGKLRDEGLRAYVADTLGPAHLWSASQFNELGKCGYHFFARRLLKLEALKAPEEGLDVLQLGSIYHEILEHTYHQLAQQQVSITPEGQTRALEILYQVANTVLPTAPERFGFRPTAVWDEEKVVLLRRLEALVRLDFSADNPVSKKFPGVRQLFAIEQAFGTGNAATVTLDLGAEVGALRLNGKIDRMDRIDDQIVVIDYKSGSTKIPLKEMEIGRNFQMLVYLAAAEQLLIQRKAVGQPREVLGGLFWHLGDRQTSGTDRNPLKEAEARDKARAHLTRYLLAARQGDFSVAPTKLESGRCSTYCEFHQLCRVANTNRYKR